MMMRTSNILMGLWWCLFCVRPICWVEFL